MGVWPGALRFIAEYVQTYWMRLLRRKSVLGAYFFNNGHFKDRN
mgnify:CR=1 FL=1